MQARYSGCSAFSRTTTGQDLGFHVWKLGLWLEGAISAYATCEAGAFKIPLARVSYILYMLTYLSRAV